MALKWLKETVYVDVLFFVCHSFFHSANCKYYEP